MKHLLISLALALLAGAGHGSAAGDVTLRQDRLNACIAADHADLSIALSKIPGCAFGESSDGFHNLCQPLQTSTDISSYQEARDRLTKPSIRTEALCSIEAAVAKAQRECTTSRVDVSSVLQLLRLLAYDWRKKGNLTRADTLYCEAYRQALRSGSTSFEVAVLQEWAFTMLQLDDVEDAKSTILYSVAVARDEYRRRASSRSAISTLVDALEFQARTFESLKLPATAQAARDEAQRLSARLPECKGICDDTIERAE